MLRFRPLPWEYGIRNLFRRPVRTLLTFAGLTVVVYLVFVVVGFIRGLERTLAVSGDADVAIIFSRGMGENLEYSSVPMRTGDLLASSIPNLKTRYGKVYVSPELYLGTQIESEASAEPGLGLVRGIDSDAVLLVRREVELEDGDWPKTGEAVVGRMAATKLGLESDALRPGETVQFEGRSWRISGVFSAGGASFESEVWCRLDDLQQAMKRQDLSIVALSLAPNGNYSDLEQFCLERLDLDLQSIREPDYYESLQADYGPIRQLAWLVVSLVSGAGMFAGLNTMYGSVVGRISELAMLQTLGYTRRAIVLSLIQEGVILAVAASLAATGLAFLTLTDTAVKFTMGAFALNVDGLTVLIGCGVGVGLGLLGAIPPAFRALRMPIVDGLRTV